MGSSGTMAVKIKVFPAEKQQDKQWASLRTQVAAGTP